MASPAVSERASAAGQAPAARNETLRTAGVALALANLYMLGVWDELHDHWFDYFRDVPLQTWPIFGGYLVDLLLLAFLFWGLLTAMESARGFLLRKSGCLLLLALFVAALDVVRTKGLHLYGAGFLRAAGKSGAILAGGILACGLIYLILMRDRALVRAIRFSRGTNIASPTDAFSCSPQSN